MNEMIPFKELLDIIRTMAPGAAEDNMLKMESIYQAIRTFVPISKISNANSNNQAMASAYSIIRQYFQLENKEIVIQIIEYPEPYYCIAFLFSIFYDENNDEDYSYLKSNNYISTEDIIFNFEDSIEITFQIEIETSMSMKRIRKNILDSMSSFCIDSRLVYDIMRIYLHYD